MEKLTGDNISIIGTRHIKNNVICQDSSGYFCNEKYCIAIVCDGHGGDKYFRSHMGSLFAVEVGLNAFKEFVRYEKSFSNDREKLLIQLEKNIILNWNNSVNIHLEELPFTDIELDALNEKDKYSVLDNVESAYGTTFIAVLMTAEYTLGLQIGDGDCVVLKSSGQYELPIPKDDRLLFNITTSLCDKKAIMNFRHFWMDEPIISAILSTDGVRDSFSTLEYYLEFCKSIFESYNESGIEGANLELRNFLPQLSEKGSGDDLSISIIFDKEKLERKMKDLNKEVLNENINHDSVNQELD